MNDRRNRVRIECHALGREAVLPQLLGDQKLSRDCQLLLVEITGEPDDLHAVAEWLGHLRKEVGRRHEQHLRKVVIDLEVVIVERTVLLRVEHLQQCR